MLKAPQSSAHTRPTDSELAAVELPAHLQTPVVAVDRRWCFPSPVTLRVEENPLTHNIKVERLDGPSSKEMLLEIRRVEDATGMDLFHVVETATQELVLTVEGAPRGHYNVFRGLHERVSDAAEREPGLLAVAATRTGSTIQFQDTELRRPSRAMLPGGLRDRVALVSVHHGVAWQPVARVTRPEHAFYKLPYSTLEIAAGVDVLLPLTMWLCRWAVYELEQRIGARPTTGDSVGFARFR